MCEECRSDTQGCGGPKLSPKKEWRENPVDDPHSMYCSAFVRYCYKEAGADFLGRTVSISNTTPEHVAQAGIKAGKLIRYKP